MATQWLNVVDVCKLAFICIGPFYLCIYSNLDFVEISNIQPLVTVISSFKRQKDRMDQVLFTNVICMGIYYA